MEVEHDEVVPTISLSHLRRGDIHVVADTLRTLQTRGFCWVHIDDELAVTGADAISAADVFLSDSGFGTGAPHALQGHFSAAFKDGVRLVTGDRLHKAELQPAVDMFRRLAVTMDAAQVEVATAIAHALRISGVLRHDPKVPACEGLGHLLSIPLLRGPKSSESYGLLDIVRYHPCEVPWSSENLVMLVDEHLDPGFLVLSLPATGPGLELMNENKEWCRPPTGAGVIWAGSAASILGLCPCLHRVVVVPGCGARVSVWHELCTSSQLSPPMLERMEQEGSELAVEGIGDRVLGTRRVLEFLANREDRLPDAFSFYNGALGVPVGKVQVPKPSFLEPQYHNQIFPSPTFRDAGFYGIPISKSHVVSNSHVEVNAHGLGAPQPANLAVQIDTHFLHGIPRSLGIPMSDPRMVIEPSKKKSRGCE